MEAYSDTLLATFLVSLRFIPLFSFSPPFTLMRVPLIIRVLLGLSLALWMTLGFPEFTRDRVDANNLFAIALSEILIGMTIALTLQWAFAAIFMLGRSLDIQAGFGMAMLADPTTRAQIPLIGTVLAYGGGAVFFAIGGASDLLAIFVESVIRIPLGAGDLLANPGPLIAFISSAFFIAVGLVGLVMLVLFLIDLTVAFLSRTLPQMNVLLIGFQVKTLAVLATLPLAISFALASYLRLIRGALQTSATMVGG